MGQTWIRKFRTQSRRDCYSEVVSLRQKQMRTLRPHSLGQAASVRPARPIAFAGLTWNSPNLHCCPDARSRAARGRFCHTVVGSRIILPGWIGGTSGVGGPARAHPSLTTVTIAAQPPASRHSKHAASRSAAAAATQPATQPWRPAEIPTRKCDFTI